MQQQDQSESTQAAEVEEEEKALEAARQVSDDNQVSLPAEQESEAGELASEKSGSRGIDKLALALVLLVGAAFALVGRMNVQPAPSFIPVAVLSATGCGLLVTALRKLRTLTGPGLFEAAMGGFFLALFQFAVALTYPGLFSTLNAIPGSVAAFLCTWGLIALFATALSMLGATLGHLAFAPLRPLPERTRKRIEPEDEDEEDEEVVEAIDLPAETTASALSDAAGDTPDDATEETTEVSAEEIEEHVEVLPVTALETSAAPPRPSLFNYAISILLLGLLPMISGYIFAAAYDFVMSLLHADTIVAGVYPTLSLLGALLPWRVAAPIGLSGTNASYIVFVLLWRIPDSFLGNPNTFDVQTLEPLLFNAAGLAFLLLTMYGRVKRESKPQAAPWRFFLFFEGLLGLFIILPANLWMLQGLEGILQIFGTTVQLPTVHFLNATMFILNLVTGALFCPLVALVVRRQHSLWSQPRRKSAAAGV